MNLKQKLDYHYYAFDKSKIEPDPLQFLHKYIKPEDIETAGFIASVFAYGSVTQIINTLNRIFQASPEGPYEFVCNYNQRKFKTISYIKHRFYTPDDINEFFKTYKNILYKWHSLKYLFSNHYSEKDKNIKNPLNYFSDSFLNSVKNPSPGIKFMFPRPDSGSSCKRMNLFLRWMIRKDELDFGIWNEISPSKLIIPVDTHIARICIHLGLTKRKIVSWAMAEEITESLKKFDPDDPVKYDFALCHIGMRKLTF